MTRPFLTLERASWAALSDLTSIRLDQETLDELRGIGDPTDQADVAEVYRPLTQLMHLTIENASRLNEERNAFLGLNERRTPFVIGVAGSVAVGKSTVSRLLQELLRHAPGNPKVDLVTTDGFLYPNAQLERRGILDRKGFPQSYNRRALLRFVMDVKSGLPHVEAPVYSHSKYDIVPDERIVIESPDILILEGLNVLQPARVEKDRHAGVAVSDFFDFSVFVDAREEHIKQWFTARFLELKRRAELAHEGFFVEFQGMTDEEAAAFASEVWESINGPNLRQNIAPTKGRATAILTKGADHRITEISIRKV
ncbi:type I pantothenate kinase [uncultured Tessaracoccus sp.]|uniref:type I pantothenate kinase n=1 Tax=uncultured Tessaracoccus sp. TaxID=905023 RepID=UPI0025E25AFE|nr:type I pantothenate kinase [uncultured Tessaracoccus sp.]